ncbi:MAG: hypothetical protein GSR72_00270 [Desulfurococcales archaeon]|nr:hypothetical protein [Desulfurococcales archaeon]
MMGVQVFREVTTSYDSRYGGFSGTLLALEDTRLTIIAGPDTYNVQLDNGRAIQVRNVPLQRILVSGKILLVGIDHPLMPEIPPLFDLWGQIFELSRAPSLEDRLDTIDNDLNSFKNSFNDKVVDIVATEDTLAQINTKMTQPTGIHSNLITIDNSAGTEDLVQTLVGVSTPSRRATLYRDPGDSGTVYIGDSQSQDFPFNPGDTIETMVSDLSVIYVRVPAGLKANIYVLYEN